MKPDQATRESAANDGKPRFFSANVHDEFQSAAEWQGWALWP